MWAERRKLLYQKIINAAYKIFAQNSYKKAPMSEIAGEGNISKALLFHYFQNKKDLYFFLWDKAVEQVKKTSYEQGVLETTDFFEIIYRSLWAKCSAIRSYPYLYHFAMNAYYEQEAEIKEGIQKHFHKENRNSEKLIGELWENRITKQLYLQNVSGEMKMLILTSLKN